jgi:hypothetical protein
MINDLVDLNRLYIKKLHSNAILKWNKQVTFWELDSMQLTALHSVNMDRPIMIGQL